MNIPNNNWNCGACKAPNPPNTTRCNSCGTDPNRPDVGVSAPPPMVAGMTPAEMRRFLGLESPTAETPLAERLSSAVRAHALSMQIGVNNA